MALTFKLLNLSTCYTTTTRYTIDEPTIYEPITPINDIAIYTVFTML